MVGKHPKLLSGKRCWKAPVELLQRAIEAYCGAVLVSSHDEEFVQGVGPTKVLEL